MHHACSCSQGHTTLARRKGAAHWPIHTPSTPPPPQAEEIQRLQLALVQAREALERERHRADLYQQQLEAHLATAAAPAPCAGQNDDDCVRLTRQQYELLLLKDRAMNAVREGITIADCSQPDMPLIYVNQGFERITGYPVAEVLGKNCRFLQGADTDPKAVAELRRAISEGQPCVVQLTNYKKTTNERFVNYLSLTPIRDTSGRLTHYVGVQSDITDLVEHKQAELAAKNLAVQVFAAAAALCFNVFRCYAEILISQNIQGRTTARDPEHTRRHVRGFAHFLYLHAEPVPHAGVWAVDAACLGEPRHAPGSAPHPGPPPRPHRPRPPPRPRASSWRA